jgi:hypothetical protein
MKSNGKEKKPSIKNGFEARYLPVNPLILLAIAVYCVTKYEKKSSACLESFKVERNFF